MIDLSAIQPINAIIAAIITAVSGLFVAYFVSTKRKKITFRIWRNNDLNLPLLPNQWNVRLSIDDRTFNNLNIVIILVRNTGNDSIYGLNFDIEIPGNGSEFLIRSFSPDKKLQQSVKVTYEELNQARQIQKYPVTHVILSDFLNPDESFKLFIFTDTVPGDCVINCRIADVKSTVKMSEYKSLGDILIEIPYLIGAIAAFFVIVASAASIGSFDWIMAIMKLR
jgi:hypothetical protein